MAVLGVMIEGQEGLTWERWRHLCQAVEEHGFDSLWRSDHFFSVMGEGHRANIETWISLALAAEWTKKLTFGVLVSPMTFRHPANLARMAASVDALSGGRLVLGVGAGWYENEHQVFHIPFPPTARRMDALDEGIRIIREVWAVSDPQPARGSVPLLVGGSGEKRTLATVAREAEEWNMYTGSPQAYAEKVAALDAHCRAIGRDPGSVRRSMMFSYIIGKDHGELLDRAEELRAVNPRYREMTPPQILEAARGRSLVGTPEEIADQLQPYIRLGASRFMLQHFLLEDDAALDLLITGVAPRIAGQGGQ
jgi:alkanesulfonate monooxygenase SsuD/methylene tetrahydromethanopterin reductase-like flavin-dependent oxidoreductase (luciferase family)